MIHDDFDKADVMLFDAHYLQTLKAKIIKENYQPDSVFYQKWLKKLQNSQNRVLDRKKICPVIRYPESLPVSQNREEIKTLISTHQVIILTGETGSGKTTQLPKMCLELGLAHQGLIGHTQPRRLAAHSIAERLSEELSTPLGESVGYQIRFLDKTSPKTLIKLMTDGILLSEIKSDPLLLNYQVIIIDEAHERSLNIDFLLGYLKRIIPKRPELKVIITSATINVDLFSNHFSNAPIYQVSGRGFPIETFYSDLENEKLADLPEEVLNAVKKIERSEAEQKSVRTGGSILVFLACERDIKETQLRLKKNGYLHDQIYLLYARLSKKEQTRVFSKNNRYRKIILSTNIAETSLTIPGVSYVIDSGKVRMSRYNHRTKVQQLPIENISKASANQRQGRCGREGPGQCYRLYTQSSFELMSEETEAEILRTNLASVLLMSLELKIGALSEFPFVQKPDNRYIKDAFSLLGELQALDKHRNLSVIGRRLARLNIDPRLGRMVLAANQLNCLGPVSVITACIAIQDPREYPADRTDYARQMHARFSDKNTPSDFHSILLVWCYYQEQKKALSNNALRKKLSKECLNIRRLNEWEDLVYQLMDQMKENYTPFTADTLSLDLIHKACLSGLLSNIGKKDENKVYLGARNKRFIIFPGSTLYKKTPEWLMASELVETDKLYARLCAPFETEWLFEYAKPLIKHNYSEPHWSKKNKKAMVYQSSLLFGLLISDNEKIPLSLIDKALSREFLIKALFIEGDLNDYFSPVPDFWIHNLAVREEIHALESKSRRLDILLEDDSHYHLYHQAIPDDIVDFNGLTKWLKAHKAESNKRLSFSKRALMRHSAEQITGEQFPDKLIDLKTAYPLTYEFNPKESDDGVSVRVPIEHLLHCSEALFSWLVPGFLEEKCIALLKTLPKHFRKSLMPIPDLVHEILFDLEKTSDHLLDFLEYKIKMLKNLRISKKDYKLSKLDPFYLMNIKVLDKQGEVVAQGRDLSLLRMELTKHLEKTLNQSCAGNVSFQKNYTSWGFGSLNEAFNNKEIKEREGVYPSLVLNNQSASLQLLSNSMMAYYETKKALIVFVKTALVKEINYMEKKLFNAKAHVLILSREGELAALKSALVNLILEETFFIDESLPQTKEAYLKAIESNKTKLLLNAQRFEEALISALKIKQEIKAKYTLLEGSYANSLSDIKTQLYRLFDLTLLPFSGAGVLYYPRYLKAIKTRLEKLPRMPDKDMMLMKEANFYEEKLWGLLEKKPANLGINKPLNAFRFLLEEFRISLFDQSIKTLEKVSLKRLEKIWLSIQ